MASMLDRGDSYKVKYLGSNMLTVTALTGLGVLQKPLKEMYFRFRKDAARAPIRLQERHLMMNDNGMVVSNQGGGDTRAENEFYAMPNILSWHAVQFVTVKGNDKKLRAAFGPLDNEHSRNKDNLFDTLEKPFQFLHQQRHPPLFCCVLRRTQGVKALDVHAFVCHSGEEAIGLVRALNTIHSSYVSEEQHETGVFGYNPFGKESVRTAAGLERTALGSSAISLDKGEPRREQQFILRQSGDVVDETANHGQQVSRTQSVNVRDRHSPVKSPVRPVSKDITLLTGSQPNLAASVSRAGQGPVPKSSAQNGQGGGAPRDRNSRVFMLSQADFASQPTVYESEESDIQERVDNKKHRSKSAKSLRQVSKDKVPQKDTYDYLQHIDRTLEKPQNRRSPRDESKSLKSAGREVPIHYNSDSVSSDYTSDPNLSFAGGGIFQEDRNYPNSSLAREHKQAKSPRSDQSMGQGYSLLSSSSGALPGYAPHQNSRQPYAPSPTTQERAPSPTYQHTISRSSNKLNITSEDQSNINMGLEHNTTSTYENIDTMGSSGYHTRADRNGSGAYHGPIVPQRSPILRKTDSLRRDAHISPERRHTTQGTVMAQVTPQSQRGSSPFGSRRGPPGSNRDNASASGNRGMDSSGSSKAIQSETPVHTRPVAKVPPHKIQGVKVLPSQPSIPKRDNSVSGSGNIHQRLDSHAMTNSLSKDVMQRHLQSSMYMDNSLSNSGRKNKSPNKHMPEQRDNIVPDSPLVTDTYAMPNKHDRKSSQKVNSKQKEQSKPKQEGANWQFQKTPPKDSVSNKQFGSPPSGSGDGDKGQGGRLIQSEKKDAEIASLLQNIHFDYEGTLSPNAPHGTNFEKSLGYFP